MSANIHQVFIANPITTNQNTDLMYFGRSPYGAGNDAAMTFQNFAAQFGGGGVTPAQVQQSAFNAAIDSGADGTAYVVTLSPVPSSYTDGMIVIMTPAHNNSVTSPTIDVNGLGAKSIFNAGFSPLAAGGGNEDINVDSVAVLQYCLSQDIFYLLNPFTFSGLHTANGIIFKVGDTGTANNYIGSNGFYNTFSATDGTIVSLLPANTNTGASTFTFNGGSALPIVLPSQLPLAGGEMVTDIVCRLMYSATITSWLLLDSALPVATATQVQSNAFNYGIDSGIADAYNVAITPAITTPYAGMILVFNALNSNTTSSPTIALNGGTPSAVSRLGQSTILPGDIQATTSTIAIWDGSNWELINTPIIMHLAFDLIFGRYTTGTDTGTANAYVVPTVTNFPGGYPAGQGSPFNLIPANSNTGASTLNLTGYGAGAITYPNGTALNSGALIAGQSYSLYSNTSAFPPTWVVLNASA